MPDSPEEIRDAQRRAWSGLAAGWERWDAVITDQLAPVGDALLERLDLPDGYRHLDLASGTGEPGLTLAQRQPQGRVVLTDLAAPMLEVAGRRAQARGITNVEVEVCSADDLPFGDASFDGVTVRFGYMFFPDLAGATAEAARVLRPGAHLCSSVWVEPEQNPWTSIVMEALAAEPEVVVPPADPDRPSMFRCAAPGFVRHLYEGAGLHDVDEWDVPVELVTRSGEEYWAMISEHVSLAVAALAPVDPATRQRVRDRALEAVRPYERDGLVRVPGLARCTIGTR